MNERFENVGMRVLHEFRSKLVGAECRLFNERLEIETPSRNSQTGSSTETVLYEEVAGVRVTGWSGVSLANLVIRTKTGRRFEVRMLPGPQAEQAKLLIGQYAGLTDSRAATRG